MIKRKEEVSKTERIKPKPVKKKELAAEAKAAETDHMRTAEFARKILSIRNEEEAKLAYILHNETGAMAIAMGAYLNAAKEEIRNNNLQGALKNIRETQKVLKRVIKTFKNIAVDLRPQNLGTTGLLSMLRSYFANITKQTEIKVDFSASIDEKRIDNNTMIILYRVVQEVLTNTIKYAQAKRVKIRLYPKRNSISLNICDNGNGFDIEKNLQESKRVKMGIQGMRESVESLGGTFIIKSAPKEGTEINVLLPYLI